MVATKRAPSHPAAPGRLNHSQANGPQANGHRQERIGEIQRARMLAAMAEVCAERGAANVTVAHVVARSGVSRRTFYEQFADREDCFLAALDEALSGAAGYVLPAFRAPGRWRERIRGSLIGLLSFLEDEPCMGRLLIVETLGAGARAVQRRQQVLVDAIEAIGQTGGEFAADRQLPPLAAEGVLGGVLSVLYARMVEFGSNLRLLELTGSLMSMIVLPYLGPAAARRELERPTPQRRRGAMSPRANPLEDLDMRLTYRTVRVLMSVSARPGSSNREIGLASDMHDQGQTSKLLTRLEKLGLIENSSGGQARGSPNAWTLTPKGVQVQRTIAQQAAASSS